MHSKRSNISRVFSIAVVAAILLTACAKTPEESKHIPKNAGVVIGINSKQIVQKLVTNGITMDKFFSSLQEQDTSSEAAKAMKDIENSGVDINSNFFASVVFGENGAASYVSLTGSLKDAGKFENFLKQKVQGVTPTAKGDFTYAWLPADEALVGWNKQTVIYLRAFDMDELKHRGQRKMMGIPDGDDQDSSEDAAIVDSAAAIPTVLTVAEDGPTTWVPVMDHLFHLKDNETAGSIEAFKSLLKENADATFFVNPQVIVNGQQLTMMPANFKELLDGSFYTAAVNFEEGKVVMNGRSYAGKKMAEIYKKYGNITLDMDMLEKYPSDNIDAFVAYGYDMRMLGDIIKTTGMDGIVNMGLGQAQLTMDDILNAFKGQMVFVSSDFSMGKKPNPYFPQDSIEKADSKWVFAMKVGDKAAFEKVMNSPMVKQWLHKEGDQYVMEQAMPGMPALSINDKLVVAASDSALLQSYLSGKGKATLDNEIAGKIKGNPLGAYVNFEKFAAGMPADQLQGPDSSLKLQAKNLLKDLRAVSQPFNGSTQESQVVLNFKNSSENSLAQLVNLGMAFAKYHKEHKDDDNTAAGDSMMVPQGLDSAAVAP
ncbi:DUF4836 family protein [Chitinophaga agrisoli]|uniref:DUF4836 family protein n=1 Tax=Chitinophaga agrisoli TaxID=2607653 RepID=A0A5B2W3H8_9BACT|nr:DUF4836 family protein [Chitinophaga agrisoli]KAA2245076.1 DUF4836 family protein [Chitinophaga agrisoli]